jgi:RNA polymerase sigma-70 factor (ECF subfamily)
MENAQSQQATRVSLLGRLRVAPADHQAWAEFVNRYGPLILRWCRRWKLQEADAEDVTQNVLVRLAEKLRTFEYDPARSFRAYVKTVAHYVWCDFLESRRRPGAGSGDSEVLELLDTQLARDDLATRLSAEFDHELLEAAQHAVRVRVEPRTWEAFQLTAVDQLSGAEVAARLGMTVPNVFKARSKVQKMLREEVRRLGGDGADE